MPYSRKELKHDPFVEEVGHQVEYFREHKTLIISVVVAIIVAIVGGSYYYSHQQERAAEARQALADAIRQYHGTVTLESRPGFVTFTTTSERVRVVTEAFDAILEEFPGRTEATAAQYYLGLLDIEQGKQEEARAKLEPIVDASDEVYASLARLALADLLARMGETEAAREHYQYLAENPTSVVPAARAKLALGRFLAEVDPEEARPVLEELLNEPGPAAAAAGAALRELQGS